MGRLRRRARRPSATCSATGWHALGYDVFRPGRHLLRHDRHRARWRPGLSAQDFCLALPGRCGVVAIPSSVFYDPADPDGRADAGALGLLQARRRAARRAGPLSIVGTMTIPITWVDAFSDVAFGGNPAAVCLLDRAARRRRACSPSPSSSASPRRPTSRPPTTRPTFGLRWFSPATEIDLCGHATLASAHALREGGTVDGTAAADLPHPQRPAARRLRRRPHRARLPGRPRDARPAARPAEGAVAGRRRGERRDRLLHLRRALLGRGGAAPTCPTWPPSRPPGPRRSC